MRKRSLTIGMTLALAGSAFILGGASAADMTTDTPHPAHIHSGTCPKPGDVVASLSDVTSQFLMDGTAMATAPMGQTTAIPVEASGTTVKLAYADILGSPHAIVVHKSAQEIGTYILCGDIGGAEMGAADLPVGLAALNDSGFSGIATLHDNGDGSTRVDVVIIPPNGMMTPAGPAPSMDMHASPTP
jgi:hypothetical protein